MSRNPPIHISPRSGRIVPGTSHCKMLMLGPQDAGGWIDRMGGPTAEKFDAGFTDAEAWATNPGFLTTGVSGINDYMTRAASSGHGISLAGRAGLIVFRYKCNVPGANAIVLGSYTSTTFPGGIQLTANANGSLALAVNTVGNVTVSLVLSASYNPLDGNEHTASFWLPPDAVSAQIGFDGEIVSTTPSTGLPGQNCDGNNIMNFGASRGGSAKDFKFAAVHIYNPVTDTLAAINVAAVTSWLHDHPMEMVPPGLWGVA